MRLLLSSQRRIDLQHALGKLHPHLLPRQINSFQVSLSERHIIFLSTSASHNQQRRFAGSELHIFNPPDLVSVIEDRAPNQVADVIPTALQFRALSPWHLQLRPDQRPSIRHRIDANELQNQQALMRPEAFNLNLAPRVARLAQREQLHPLGKAIRNIAVNLSRDFAMSPLRLHHAGQRDELHRFRHETLLDDLELIPLARPMSRRAQQGPQRAGGSPLASDHFADVVLGDFQFDHAIVELLDEDLFRRVDQRLRDQLDERTNISGRFRHKFSLWKRDLNLRSRGRIYAAGAGAVAGAFAYSLFTRSDICAPFDTQ